MERLPALSLHVTKVIISELRATTWRISSISVVSGKLFGFPDYGDHVAMTGDLGDYLGDT
ncbi:MAG TPA: hypothetical protein VFP59_16015 [Candidatus Angelobacter sp.]|nr:hypothetical protein [Candidatus Angelobacter sp.]